MKTLKHIGAVLAISALALPAGVSAKGPSGDHGQSGEQNGKTKTQHVNSRCKKQPKVGFSLGGTLEPSSTAENIVVVVTNANKHSKPFVVDGKYTVPAGSKVEYEGANPFTTPGADLSKYAVKVGGKVVKYKKGCTADNAPAPTVKKVKIHAPETTETPEQPATTGTPQS